MSVICDKLYTVRKMRAPLVEFSMTLPRVTPDDKSPRVTLDQYSVLTILNNDPVNTQQALVSMTSIDRSTMAEIVKRLRDRGFVTINPDPTDRRKNNVKITPAGKTILKQCRKAEEKYLKKNVIL